jgi:glycosyltransferase involved in cell wall biosynthesis
VTIVGRYEPTISSQVGDTRSVRPEISVVIPLYNEVENIDDAVAELLAVLDELPCRSEVILVDDGSKDGTGALAMEWRARDPRVGVVQFRRNFGQTAAIDAGFRAAEGRTIILMDGDMQNDPRDIPRLLAGMDDGYDVVSGWRKDRKDKVLMRKFPSKIANRLISRITGTHLHDYGCTLKAYNADVIAHLNLYGELHRFIPALASQVGANVLEIPVNHRPRTRGKSKYGIDRTIRVVLDLITVTFLLRYLSRPMQYFGRLGLLSMTGGTAVTVWLIGQKVLFGHGLAERPLFLLGLAMVGLGVLLVSIGLLGELMTRSYHEGGQRSPYVVRHCAFPLAREIGG